MKLYECTKPKTKSIVTMEYINLLPCIGICLTNPRAAGVWPGST